MSCLGIAIPSVYPSTYAGTKSCHGAQEIAAAEKRLIVNEMPILALRSSYKDHGLRPSWPTGRLSLACVSLSRCGLGAGLDDILHPFPLEEQSDMDSRVISDRIFQQAVLMQFNQ